MQRALPDSFVVCCIVLFVCVQLKKYGGVLSLDMRCTEFERQDKLPKTLLLILKKKGLSIMTCV